MKMILKSLAIFGLLMSQSVNATVITFDDIGATPTWDVVGSGYAGFDWDNVGYINVAAEQYINSGYESGNVSAEYTAFNTYGNLATVSGGGIFDFNSAYLTAAWNTGLNITVEGWNGGILFYSETIVVDTLAATLFTFDFIGIDTLTFDSFGGVDANGVDVFGAGTHFAMDNFTYNETSVPEPAVLALLGLGLFGIGAARRVRNKG